MAQGTGISGINHWRMVGWSIPLLLLALPFIAQAPWTLSDYLFMGALFGIAGLLVEMGIKFSAGSIAYRIGAGIAVLAGFLLAWVNGAVGFLGDEGNPANLMFGGVIAVAILGAFLAHFQPAGMARAMLAAAVVQVLAGAVGFAAGWASPGADGIYEVMLGTTLFGTLWLVAAGLFAKRSRNAVDPWTRQRWNWSRAPWSRFTGARRLPNCAAAPPPPWMRATWRAMRAGRPSCMRRRPAFPRWRPNSRPH